MIDEDDERIERALQRRAMGLELSAQDLWCLGVHGRREHAQREPQALDTVLVDDSGALFDADGELNETLADGIGYVLGETIADVRKEFRADSERVLENVARLLHGWMQHQAADNNRTRELEQQIGELRGELRVVRAMLDDSSNSNKVIDLPMKWRRGGAA